MNDMVPYERLSPPEPEETHRCICTCDKCREPIWEGDFYFALPDGLTVCEECLPAWAKDYLVFGGGI